MTTLVDPRVTNAKVDRELELWSDNADAYRRRGWILLGRNNLQIDIAFIAKLPMVRTIPIVSACIRLDFTNYDLWAPSLEFIDPTTGDFDVPLVPALIETEEGPRDLIVASHPSTSRPFFCVPGVRQYHEHPQHSGDGWLLHRTSKEGSLATICDRVWRSMVRNLAGLNVSLLTLPEGQVQLQVRVVNAPGEPTALLTNLASAQHPPVGAP
jgi:hypothetical protein